MEWRKINVCPNSRSGKFYSRVHGHSLILGTPLYSRDDYDPAYTESDVLTFFRDRKQLHLEFARKKSSRSLMPVFLVQLMKWIAGPFFRALV